MCNEECVQREESYSIQDRMSDLQKIVTLLDGVKASKKKRTLTHKFAKEMDALIGELERLYYNHFLSNKNEDKIVDEVEKHIFHTQNTILNFLPLFMSTYLNTK
jgi:hypothetical protein